MSATTSAPSVPTGSGDRLDPALIRLAAILLTGAIAPFLDTTIVNVALDDIGRGLHADVGTVQWVLTGYLLAFGMVVPLSGWALRRFGGRPTWMFSLGLFLAGSVLCGTAWNIGSLIVFRVIQGIGGGLMVPILLTLLVQAAGGRKLGRLMATVSLPVVIVPILGPVVGGLIVSSLSWRWIFYVNVPVCLAGLALAWRGLRDVGRPQPGQRLDLLGLALLSPGVAAILYGLAQVSTRGGFGHLIVLGPLLGGLAAVGLFALRTLRLGQRAEPVLDLRLFRIPSFAGAASLMFLFGLSLYGAMLLLPLYYQQLRGASALAAGLLLAPQGVGSLLPRLVIGRLTDRFGPRPVVLAGTLVAALGTLPFALATAHTSEILLSAALVVRGAGLGGATIAVMAAAFEGLEPGQVPHASSATRIMQQVGGAFGASVLAVILARLAAGHPGALGLASAFRGTFWWCLACTVLALGPALLLSRAPRPRSPRPR
jgi:EmrB/QacA subfamily drug resistance transporter